MSGAIVIFAKTPGLTPAKTRLAETIGPQAAADFHRLAIDAVAASVSRFLIARPDWVARWAVAEPEGVGHPLWQGFGARHTGSGSLGDRMWRMHEAFRRVHGHVLLIGADAPQLDAAHLEAAAESLQAADHVFGPARDGGFWLFGSRRRIPREVWLRPRYSTADAMTDFAHELAALGHTAAAPLALLGDVDREEDLLALGAEWPKRMTGAQERLARWIVQGRPPLPSD